MVAMLRGWQSWLRHTDIQIRRDGGMFVCLVISDIVQIVVVTTVSPQGNCDIARIYYLYNVSFGRNITNTMGTYLLVINIWHTCEYVAVKCNNNSSKFGCYSKWTPRQSLKK